MLEAAVHRLDRIGGHEVVTVPATEAVGNADSAPFPVFGTAERKREIAAALVVDDRAIFRKDGTCSRHKKQDWY
jgi:hypothetical protein